MKPTTFAEQAAALLKWLRVRTSDSLVHISCGAWMADDRSVSFMCTVGTGATLLPPFVVEPDATPLTCLACLSRERVM